MQTDFVPPLYGTIPASVTVEVLLRNPGGTFADGTEIVPEVRSLMWQPVELAREPEDCVPGETLCSKRSCMESWSWDHYLRVVEHGTVVWTSPDHPDRAAVA